MKQENCVYETVVLPLDERAFEKTLTPIIQEYFEHGDTNEVSVCYGPFYFFVLGVKAVADRVIKLSAMNEFIEKLARNVLEKYPSSYINYVSRSIHVLA